MTSLLPIDFLLIGACAWLLIGLLGLLAPRNTYFISKILFPLGAVVGVGVGAVALDSLGGPAQTAVLAIGLPDLPFHLRLDNLSAVFALDKETARLLGGQFERQEVAKTYLAVVRGHPPESGHIDHALSRR